MPHSENHSVAPEAGAITRQNEARYRTLIDAMEVGFCIFEMKFDADGTPVDYRFLDVNAAFQTLTGLVEATGQWMRDLRPTHEQHWFDVYGRIAMTGEPARFELAADALGGRWYEVHAFRIDAPELRRVAALFSDVTERRRAASGLRELNETLEARVAAEVAAREKTQDELRQAQKMEAVGQLTGGIAHDFNNLLTGITGSLDMLVTRLRQGRVGDVERYVTVAQGAAKRAAALTHRLLAFSRRQTLDPAPTDVGRLVGGVEELLRRTVGPQIDLGLSTGPTLWIVLVDAHQLENSILNLVINARDAMPEGGRVTISTANASLSVSEAATVGLSAGDYVRVAVSDTGTGMTETQISRAFEPFYTTKPLGQGTGLGLSMIYGFAQQSGGKVVIQSERGVGTTVTLYLPRHAGAASEEAASHEPAAPAVVGRGETVMVVDDEPSVRMLVMDVLDDLGCAAIEAGDGPSAMHVLNSNARIDLLITDVGLPGGMNGRQIADAARVSRPGLRVLFITGYAQNAAIGDVQLDPGMAVMTKPFAVEALAARIREILHDPG